MGRAAVFDISVGATHEFLANGILVHNTTDALRYLTAAISDILESEGVDQTPAFLLSELGWIESPFDGPSGGWSLGAERENSP